MDKKFSENSELKLGLEKISFLKNTDTDILITFLSVTRIYSDFEASKVSNLTSSVNVKNPDYPDKSR